MSEFDYVKMLEIPVNSCDVVVKPVKKRKKNVKKQVIEKVNGEAVGVEESVVSTAKTTAKNSKKTNKKADERRSERVRLFADKTALATSVFHRRIFLWNTQFFFPPYLNSLPLSKFHEERQTTAVFVKTLSPSTYVLSYAQKSGFIPVKNILSAFKRFTFFTFSCIIRI